MVLNPLIVSPNKLRYGDLTIDFSRWVSVNDFDEIFIILYIIYETIGSIKVM